MSRKKLLTDEPVNFEQALYAAARDMRGGITALAALMPLNYNTLSHKLNPLKPDHNLKPVEVERIVQLTEDIRIIELLARPVGVAVFKMQPVNTSNKALQSAGRLLNKMSGFVEELAKGADDGIWEKNEVELLERKGHEVISKLLGIMAGAREVYEQGNDADD